MSSEETAKADGRKDDTGKERWDLVPWQSVREVVRVLTYGAAKYKPGNWKLVVDARERYFAAAMRHLVAWENGEQRDAESKLPHLAHAACCLLFLLWFDARECQITTIAKLERLYPNVRFDAHLRAGDGDHA